MRHVSSKVLHFAGTLLALAFLLSGCVAYEVGGAVQKGRMELLYGDPKAALAYFQRAADLDPNYRLNYSIFPEGVWTYVGRANFATGMLPEARKALERASTVEQDNLAKLYLGLVLTRGGDRDRGVKEIQAGLQGVSEWYDWVQFYHTEGQYWDPDKRLRIAIQKELGGLTNREINTNDLVQNVAFLGREIELEIDRARDHRDLDWRRKYHGDERRN
jgi:tetratricopeptide (TPR) repeat protein